MSRLAAVALLAAGLAGPAYAHDLPAPATVDTEVRRLMQSTAARGLALAVIDRGAVTYVQAYGVRNAKGEPLQTDTVMYGASLTKTVFAYSALQLVDRGVLKLDTPLAAYLEKPLPEYDPEAIHPDKYGPYRDLSTDDRWRKITPRMALTHSTGFANFSWLEPDEKLRINFEPGSRYAYSGEGLILLQFAIEAGRKDLGLGVDMGRHTQAEFDRLGMTRTSLIWRADFRPNLADGFKSDGGAVEHDERSKVRVAGSMDTTIADFSKFAAALVRGDGLSRASRAEMTKPQLHIGSATQFPTLAPELPAEKQRKDLYAGLGLIVFEGPQGRGFYKGGHDDQTANTMVCLEASQRCVVILSNDVRAEAGFARLVGSILGDTGVPYEWEYGPAASSAAQTVPSAPASQAAQLPPLTDFVGTYAYQGSTIEIFAPEGLVAVLNDAKYPLRRKSADVFINGPGHEVTFHRGPDGVVTAVEDETGVNRRLSASISARTQARAQPRPVGSPPYRYQPPRNLRDGVPVGDVAESDLGAEAAGRIVAGVLDKTWEDVDSVLIFQGGELVLEEYFYGYDRDTPHQLRSATKSVVGAVVGAAVANGAVTLDEPVLPRLGYATVANPDPRKSAITLRHLLTLQSGLDCDDHVAGSPGGENQLYGAPDWIRVMVDLKMVDTPGTVGRYCTGATFLAGRTVEKATGLALADYAQEHLFGSLGVRRADWTWNPVLTSADERFGMMAMRPRDMLKFGMLFANGGRWGERQVLPAAWVKESLSSLSRVENTGYGYLWWRMWLRVETPDGPRRVYMSAAQGNGGQKIYLVPELDLIAVFTGSVYNTGAAPPNKIMAGVVLPALLQARGVKGDVGEPAR